MPDPRFYAILRSMLKRALLQTSMVVFVCLVAAAVLVAGAGLVQEIRNPEATQLQYLAAVLGLVAMVLFLSGLLYAEFKAWRSEVEKRQMFDAPESWGGE